ncbi:MAG: metallophosphoesterase [Cyclobacteriaceae bacterium]
MKSTLLIIIAGLILWSCQPPEAPVSFEHDITSGPTPWTSSVFEKRERDFTFAIISDLTGGERRGVYGTAVSQLNRLDPAFVLSVGDLIEGGSRDSAVLAAEWNSFEQRTARLNMPFFHLGGNHDLTNPIMREVWKSRFGPRYYHFRYEDVLFLMLDSEDFDEELMNEIDQARAEAMRVLRGEVEGVWEETKYHKMPESHNGGVSDEQLAYFTEVLGEHDDARWTFVMMHKPLWRREDDNGLRKLEELLQDRPYTVINGHIHSFSHRKRHGRDYIILGTTGGFQPENDSMAFDHVTLVRMGEEPVITHLKMNGILDETGNVPAPR